MPLSSACYAYPNPVFQPAYRLITAITNAYPAQVTTSFDHLYITGTIIRLDIPLGFGMSQVDGQAASIIVNGSDTFLINLDTTTYDPFIVPAIPIPECPMCVPLAEVAETLDAAVRNTLPH